MDKAIEELRQEPALAWKVAVRILGKGDSSAEADQARAQVKQAPLVKELIAACDCRNSAYKKWDGAHWILSILADLGYPAGDETLRPLMEHTLNTWLSAVHEKNHVRVLDGRVRRCASQEGYAVWSSLRLGFADNRTDELVSRLLQWQWPDGGWNCDKRPEANKSSFMETLIPLRALSLYASASGDGTVTAATARAAEVFLTRRLFKRLRDGALMDEHFVRLHYPAYWHYDILFGLKVMAEAGFIDDPALRGCAGPARIQTLAGWRLPGGKSYARPSRPELSGYSPVGWGGTSTKNLNPFVTADVLYVLRLAGRLK